MADKLAVWKQALVHLEKETIVALDSDSEPRYQFDIAWTGVVEEAFNEGDWNFAKKSVQLAVNGSETAAVGWNFVLDYPADYERTVAVSNTPDFRLKFLDYIDQGGFIHANTNVIYLNYISTAKQADEEVETWPTMFWRYVALKLARDTCGKLTSGSTLADTLDKKLVIALRKAKGVDARNEDNKVIQPGSWLRARQGGYGRYGNRLGPTLVGGEITFDEGDV